jgi:hypothetical protein
MSDRWSFNDNCSGQIYESCLPLSGGTLSGALILPAGSVSAPGLRLGSAATGLYAETSWIYFAANGAWAGSRSVSEDQIPSTSKRTWASRAQITSPSDGRIKIDTNAGGAGVVLGGAVANTLSIRVAADNALGAIEAASATISNKITGGNTADGSAPGAGFGQLYFQLNGSSKMELRVLFPSGAAQVLATEA